LDYRPRLIVVGRHKLLRLVMDRVLVKDQVISGGVLRHGKPSSLVATGRAAGWQWSNRLIRIHGSLYQRRGRSEVTINPKDGAKIRKEREMSVLLDAPVNEQMFLSVAVPARRRHRRTGQAFLLPRQEALDFPGQFHIPTGKFVRYTHCLLMRSAVS